MPAAVRTASERGRAARIKGAAFERAVARAIQPYFPEAQRSRDNGSINTDDTGDITGTGPGLFWSLKDDKTGDMGKPSVINAWLSEVVEKAGPHRVPILLQKRRGHSDPLTSWAWLRLGDVNECLGSGCNGHPVDDLWVRMEFRAALRILVIGNYALIGDAA
jgi:hypothetical protein